MHVALSTHHATVEVLLHLAEGVRRRLPLAGDDDTDVGDGQRVLRLHERCAAEGDEDALRVGRAVVDVGAAAVGRGLDDLAALDEALLALVEDAARGARSTGELDDSAAFLVKP